MAELSIELSKADMKRLIKFVYLGHYMLTGTKDEPNKEADEFLGRILSFGKNYINFEGIEYDDEESSYFVTAEQEEEWQEAISDYNEDTFWEELIERLGERDVERKHAGKDFYELDVEERVNSFHEEVSKYYDEVNKHGLKNIGIVKE